LIDYHGKSRRFFPTVTALRQFAPDLVLAPHINDPDVLPLLYLSGARQIVRVPWGTTRFPELLSNRGDSAQCVSVRGLHVVDERLRVIEALGLPVISRTPRVVAPPQTEIARGRAIAATGCAHYAVLHVFSADVYRTIPAELAHDCLRALGEKYPDLGWVLTGSAADRPSLEKIASGCGAKIWIAAGELSIDASAACLSGARAVISPDTGTLHLAAALDRPVLALFSPTREAATRAQVVGPRTLTAPSRVLEVPPVCDPCVGRRCSHRPVKCLQAFQVNDIVAAFGQIIEPGVC
jgi:ADP-heptose:LPS heptosyltransferase